MKKIVLTGGGTAGHVTPNIALIPALKKEGYEIHYIGSYDGIERKLIEELEIPYYGISSGKLRRYIDLKNLSDPFKVVKGLAQARHILGKIKPDVIFSKGGFVAVPVVLAAKTRRIPCVIHESDMTPGLANKICIPCEVRVCTNFPETFDYIPSEKAVLTGSPIRELPDLMAAADIMVSRAGANAICEILALRKPNILIPLSAEASRGDQILNAASFEKQGYSIVIQEKDITKENLSDAINQIYINKSMYIKAMKQSRLNNSIEKITGLVNEAASRKHK